MPNIVSSERLMVVYRVAIIKDIAIIKLRKIVEKKPVIRFLRRKKPVIRFLRRMVQRVLIATCHITSAEDILSVRRVEGETMKALSEWFVTVTQYGQSNNVSRQAVIKAIKKNRILAERVGNFWLIPKSEYGKLKV